MNTTYVQLKKAFQSFFEHNSEGNSSQQFREGDYWILFPVKSAPTDAIHYELTKHGNEFYVEFHVEMPARCIPQWQTLRDALDVHKRLILHYTYYSSNFWRCRNPVFETKEVENDLAFLYCIVSKVFANLPNGIGALPLSSSCKAVEPLPFQRNLKDVATMLKVDTLHLPAVQRGKVWNAARIETLWDSIFRGFSIGAFCVQRIDDGKFDLLDGQQRSNAIALAYDSFPPENRMEMSSILWIDIEPREEVVLNGQKKFVFRVTTPSQPWGYGDSSDETRNALLSASQRRAAIKDLKWHNENEKPYPGELYPYNSGCAVPFTLLREFLEEKTGEEDFPSFANYLKWCTEKRRLQTEGCSDYWWNWLDMLPPQQEGQNPGHWEEIIAVQNVNGRTSRITQLNDYYIAFLDAGNVMADEMATYFQRIGRGGVRPSDEELAYSVLKSHLGDEFRTKIENIHKIFGLAQPSRIAHLAVRCFRSTRTENGRTTFCSSPVLEEAIKMCKEEESMPGTVDEQHANNGRKAFLDFMTSEFGKLLKEVDKAVFTKPRLTHWHRTRFCQYNNGDIFLFLLLAIRDKMFDEELIAATAEWLYEQATHPSQTIRLILNEGLYEGLAHAMRETYYGVPRLPTPVLPSIVQKLASEAMQGRNTPNDSFSNVQQEARNAEIANLIAAGYNSQRAYGMLLYACQSEFNKRFEYDSNLGVWAEDNCPWDYDHMLPHSWIDKMNGEYSDMCQWLKNSLGNLAPLPFEMNRSLSDNARDQFYPFCGNAARENDAKQIQNDYCINGEAFKEMGGFSKDKKAQQAFIVATLTRFSELYTKWYTGLGFDKLLIFRNNRQDYGNRDVVRRCRILKKLAQSTDCSDSPFQYYSPDGKRNSIGKLHAPDTDWFVWDKVSIFKKMERFGIELCINRQCRQYEIGISRLSVGEAEPLNETVAARLSELDKTWESPQNDQYWYCFHKGEIPIGNTDIMNEDSCIEVVDNLLKQWNLLQQKVS